MDYGAVVCRAVALALAGAVPATISAQQSVSAATSLVFDGVTVVDVEQGKLLPDQRVVIVGNRIQAVGDESAVKTPTRAQVVDAEGKYLIPGLWDMHTHISETPQLLPSLVASGVTGIRDVGVGVGRFDTILRWRREVMAGTRLGPRIVATGPMIQGEDADSRLAVWKVTTPEEARHAVDSLKAAGADFIKIHGSFQSMSHEIYFAIAAESRRLGIPFMGHLPAEVSVAEASDSGQRSIEHTNQIQSPCRGPESTWPYAKEETGELVFDDETMCAAQAAQFIRNGTWFTPTIASTVGILSRADPGSVASEEGLVREGHRFGVPMLAGTDGVALAEELQMLAKVGRMTPLEALRTATLNPAKYFGATDTLGTVAVGKVADLVLLDADPLADITNATKIRAVVANGRYFDRVALDGFLAEAAAKMQGDPSAAP